MDTDRVVSAVLRATVEDLDATAHLNDELRDVIAEHGDDSIRDCVRLILDKDYTAREAGAEAFGPESYLHGLAVGSAVSIIRKETQG